MRRFGQRGRRWGIAATALSLFAASCVIVAPAPALHQDATSSPSTAVGDDATITVGDVDALMSLAATAWRGADFSDVHISIGDVDGVGLARTSGTSITFDPLAAGWGWHTATSAPPSDRIDLLTVLAHELGHVAGASGDGSALMAQNLDPGVRRFARARARTGTCTCT